MKPVPPEVIALLVCPVCRAEFAHDERWWRCLACRAKYPVVDGVPVLTPEARRPIVEDR